MSYASACEGFPKRGEVDGNMCQFEMMHNIALPALLEPWTSTTLVIAIALLLLSIY